MSKILHQTVSEFKRGELDSSQHAFERVAEVAKQSAWLARLMVVVCANTRGAKKRTAYGAALALYFQKRVQHLGSNAGSATALRRESGSHESRLSCFSGFIADFCSSFRFGGLGMRSAFGYAIRNIIAQAPKCFHFWTRSVLAALRAYMPKVCLTPRAHLRKVLFPLRRTALSFSFSHLNLRSMNTYSVA